MLNLYKTIKDMGVYEAECYIYDFASRIGQPNHEGLAEVMKLIEGGKIEADDTPHYLPLP